jgi:hypothetical protein
MVLVDVLREPWTQQHLLELGEEGRTRDDLDAVIDERADHQIRRAAAAADERRDEDTGVDDDPDHAAPRSRREAWASS